jgi:yeast amino acid transporter
MIAICPLLFVGWKVLKKTKIPSAAEIDLQKNMDEIAAYERSYVPKPPG